MGDALKQHWPEYLMEAAALGIFMISACAFGVLLEHPDSPVRQAISDPVLRRVLAGIAMGLTAVGIIYSPWGKQSGAHMNPAITLTFFRLGRIQGWDALFYMVAQFAGGLAGVLISAVALSTWLKHPGINYVVTVPGPDGTLTAFAGEAVISFLLMAVVLLASNSALIGRFTGLFAGALIALYIAIEAPLSGMSMNPARTFGSALPAQTWNAWWIYFTAPPLAMLLAGEAYLRVKGAPAVHCAKIHHQNKKRCIFCGAETI